jgi:hypothetical protein
MDNDNSSLKQYWYTPAAGFEARSRRRLQADLGIDEASAEMILRLRSQILDLQAQVRRLEAELAAQNASQEVRLARYRDIYAEISWIEIDFSG